MKIFIAQCALLLASGPLVAADMPATEASSKKLLEVLQMEQLVEGMVAQMDTSMQALMSKALVGKTRTPEEQAIIDQARRELVATVTDVLNYETLEPQYIEIYQKSFTEEEVRGMLEFYESPAGKAVITKMPAVVSLSMELGQELLMSVMPRIEEIESATLEKLKNLPAEADSASPGD